MATVIDVAKAAGVSTATVSRVLNSSELVSEQTRQQVLRAVAETGYTLPTRSRGSGELRKIIAVLTAVRMSEVEDAIIQAALAQDAGTVFLQARYGSDDSAYFAGTLHLLEKQLIGVITVSDIAWHTKTDLSLLHPYPVVQTFDEIPLSTVYHVGCDDMQMGYDAASYLIARGCRRIAIASARDNRPYAQRRIRGCQLAMLEHGLTPDSALTLQVDFLTRQNTQEGAAQLLPQLQAAAPDGVFAVTDMLAADAIAAAEQLGWQIPETLQVIGIDGNPDPAMANPRATTVAQDFATIGREAVRMLADLSAGRINGGMRTLVPHRLIPRESTRQPE